MQRVNLPIGTSDFAEIRREGWYYVDKTGLIGDLLNTRKAKVTLITRPRRRDWKSARTMRCVSSGGTNGRSSLSRSGVWTG